MTLVKESKNIDSENKDDVKNESFLEDIKQMMDENPRLYSKLAQL